MSSSLAAKLLEVRRKSLKPSPTLSLVEWSDKYRFLSPESSSQPGRFQTSVVEAARGPMLAVTDPRIKKITIMACTQLLKTELINNIVGYFIHQDPSPIIVMQPTVSLAKTWSKDRLSPMLRDTPVLNELVKTKKSRDSGNTLQHKSFPGGHITVIGSNSPSELASRPIRVTLRDEVDKYEDNVEGDPSSLIVERSATFWNALDVGVCSPTIKGRSKIEKEYEESDKREFRVDCPYCNHNQFMVWKNVVWENNNALTARYVCPECKNNWSEKDRLNAIKSGVYVATAPFNGHAGFKVNKLASPWRDIPHLVSKWLSASKEVSALKTFINTQLAETFEEKGEAPEHMRLYERREVYNTNTIPMGVVFLTCGVDVQKDRIELEIVGWGVGKESWSIDYRVIPGNTDVLKSGPWIQLDKVLNETWTASDGRHLQIRVLAVDSGYNTSFVYSWARKYSSSRVMVVKGSDTLQNILGIPKLQDINAKGDKIKRRSVRVWPIGVSFLKSEIYGFLNLDGATDDGIYPPGFCHFPQYEENYFKMLTAEQLMKKTVKGKTTFTWEQIRERNEALDCRNYARAAASMMGLDRFTDQDWLNMLELEPIELEKEIKIIPQNKLKPSEISNPYWKNSGKKSFW